MPNQPRSRNLHVAVPASATVLLVDREALYRWFVADSLSGCGVDVVACGSLDEATALLRGTVEPDLLIVDGDLFQDRDGGASLRALRERAGAIPWLVLDSDPDLFRKYLGAVMVADKPVDSATVVTLVTGQLRRGVPAN